MKDPAAIGFSVTLPLYFLARRDTVVRDNKGIGVNAQTSILGGRLPKGIAYVSIFTQENLATQFVTDNGLQSDGYEVLPITDRVSFVALLTQPWFNMDAIGFDPPPAGAAHLLPDFVVLSRQDVLHSLQLSSK
jgi:hypothetical protein